LEKFYIAEEGSNLRKDYLTYIKNKEEVNNLIINFFKENNIKAKKYYVANTDLYIEATNEDKEKFHKQLCKPENGLYRFRSNSQIGKLWLETLKSNNIKILSKPFVPFYFNTDGGHFYSRLFDINNVIYCSIMYDYDFKPNDRLTEIKASEFYKIVEDYEGRITQNK